MRWFGPRVGAAYDISGTQNIVVRGSFGVFYDRPQGDAIPARLATPTGQGSTVIYSTLQNVAAGTSTLQPPPVLLIHEHNAEVGGHSVERGRPDDAALLLVARRLVCVGTHNYNSIAFGSISTPAGQNPLDLNAPDIGAAYLPQNQDRTAASSTVPGAMAVATELLRPYRGLGPIVLTSPRFHTNYDSIQMSVNRRFRNGWQGGLNWTLGLRFEGNTLSPQHLVHNADGTIGLASYQEDNDRLLSNVGLRRHLIKGNFVWELPTIESATGAMQVIRAIANDWQLSGVFTAGSGAPV